MKKMQKDQFVIVKMSKAQKRALKEMAKTDFKGNMSAYIRAILFTAQ